MCLCPAHIHTHKHLCPVLALRTTGTRVYLHHTVHRVFLLAQHVHQLKALNGVDGGSIVGIHLLLSHQLLLVIVEGKLQFVGKTSHLLVALNPFLNRFYLLHLFLRPLGVVPEVGSLSAQLFLFKFYLLLVYIKIVVQRFGTLEHILKLIGCYHYSYILSITSLKFLYITGRRIFNVLVSSPDSKEKW